MISSEVTPFRGSLLMWCRLLESPQFPLYATQFAFKSLSFTALLNLLQNDDSERASAAARSAASASEHSCNVGVRTHMYIQCIYNVYTMYISNLYAEKF